MSVEVLTVESVVRHYERLLDQCEEARTVIESWGVKVACEKALLRDVRGWLEDLLCDEVEVI